MLNENKALADNPGGREEETLYCKIVTRMNPKKSKFNETMPSND